MFSIDTSIWAQATFQQAKLGDARRTKILISLASQLAANAGKSIVLQVLRLKRHIVLFVTMVLIPKLSHKLVCSSG